MVNVCAHDWAMRDGGGVGKEKGGDAPDAKRDTPETALVRWHVKDLYDKGGRNFDQIAEHLGLVRQQVLGLYYGTKSAGLKTERAIAKAFYNEKMDDFITAAKELAAGRPPSKTPSSSMLLRADDIDARYPNCAEALLILKDIILPSAAEALQHRRLRSAEDLPVDTWIAQALELQRKIQRAAIDFRMVERADGTIEYEPVTPRGEATPIPAPIEEVRAALREDVVRDVPLLPEPAPSPRTRARAKSPKPTR